MPTSIRLCCALLAFVFVAAATRAEADALTDGAKNYKPFAVERIGTALADAKELQAAVKANDVKAAQAAWIKSRKGWEAAEPITGEFFSKLDEAIDAWPDAKQGYHAVEAAVFAGKLDGLAAPVDKLAADLAAFDKQLSAPSFKFTPQGLLNGATKLAYEIGENKSKGGESPYAGTSLSDMYENVEGIEAVYKLVFDGALKARDPKLAIVDKIEDVETLDVYGDLTPRPAAINMAVDEALLESAEVPSLRFYRWDHPALSFGYFGRYADVLSYEPERELVRRWTGGGIVLHGADLTYSLIIPKRDPPFGSSISIYEKVHEAVRDALAATGAGAQLAAVAALYERRNHIDSAVVDRRYNPNACFTNPVRADVMVNGKKVAGAAQRRSRLGLLQQGSIQNIDLAPDFSRKFAAHLTASYRYQDLGEPLLRRAADIAKEKYATPAWLRRR